MRNKKAQTGIEFFILIIAVSIIFSLLLGVIQLTLLDKTRERNNVVFRESALRIQNEINLAASATDGYRREFYIPEEVIGKKYEASIVDNFVYLKTLDEKYAIALEIPYVNGVLVKGVNIIRKENGEIFLN